MSAPSPEIAREIVLAAVDLMGEAGRGGRLRVQGNSMLPTLLPGQELQVTFSSSRPARGTMLVFRQADMLLVHRVVGRARPLGGKPRLRTRGDGVLVFDPAVDYERIVGRVEAFGDARGWRAANTSGARAYGWMVAWHDYFWAALGVLCRRIEPRLSRTGLNLRLRPIVDRLDKTCLRVAHALFFRAAHRRIPEPERPAD